MLSLGGILSHRGVIFNPDKTGWPLYFNHRTGLFTYFVTVSPRITHLYENLTGVSFI